MFILCLYLKSHMMQDREGCKVIGFKMMNRVSFYQFFMVLNIWVIIENTFLIGTYL